MTRIYGWKPDLPSDIPWLDHLALRRKLATAVKVYDGRKYVRWVKDQKQEGACTAFSGNASERYFRSTHGLPDFDGSEQFLYYATRSLEGTTKSDSGASIMDTVTAEQKFGICPNSLWPYSKPLTAKPTAAAYKAALAHEILVKAPVQLTQAAVEAVLASGLPLHFGITVYESFESDAVTRTGVVPMPGNNEQVLGGHAIYALGFDSKAKVVTCQNSWGPDWGFGGLGFFTLPYKYIFTPDYASDGWTISKLAA